MTKLVNKRIFSLITALMLLLTIVATPLSDLILPNMITANAAPSGPKPTVTNGATTEGWAMVINAYDSSGRQLPYGTDSNPQQNASHCEVVLSGGTLSGVTLDHATCTDHGWMMPIRYTVGRYWAKATVTTASDGTVKTTWDVRIGKNGSGNSLTWSIPASSVTGAAGGNYRYAYYVNKSDANARNGAWYSIGNFQGLEQTYSYSVPPSKGTVRLSKVFYSGNGHSYVAYDTSTYKRNGNFYLDGDDSKLMYAFPNTYLMGTNRYELYYQGAQNKHVATFSINSYGETTATWIDSSIVENVNTGKFYDEIKVPAGTYYWKEYSNGYFMVPIGGSNITTAGGSKVNNTMSFTVTAGKTSSFGWIGTSANSWEESVGVNLPVAVDIKITKHGDNATYPDPNMAGATFDIYYYTDLSNSIEIAAGQFSPNVKVDRIKNTASVTPSSTWLKMASVKLDSSGKVVAGSYLYSKKLSGSSAVYSPTISNGVIENLPAGNYAIIETKAPNGYVIPNTPYQFINRTDFTGKTYQISGSDSLSMRQASAKNLNHVLKTIDITETDGNRFRMVKHFNTDNGNDLVNLFPIRYKKTGAVYTIKLNNASGNVIATGKSNSYGEISWTLSSWAKSNTSIGLQSYNNGSNGSPANNVLNNITEGTVFYIEETDPATGFMLSDPSTVTINQKNVYYASGLNCIEEYPITAKLGINKTIENSENPEEDSVESGKFNGARFEVYYTPVVSHYASNINITTQERTRTVNIVGADTYKIGEFNVVNGKIVASANTISVSNASYTAGVDNSSTLGIFTNLPLGTYMIVETKAPDDETIKLSKHEVYTAQFMFDSYPNQYGVNESGDNSENYLQYYLNTSMTNEDNKMTIAEGENDKVSINLNKVAKDPDLAVGSLKGAEYSVYFAPVKSNGDYAYGGFEVQSVSKNPDGSRSRTISIRSADTFTHVATFTVNAKGSGLISYLNGTYVDEEYGKPFANISGNKINGNTLYGPRGTYIVVETKAPKNYDFDSNWFQEQLSTDGRSTLSLTSEEPSISDPIRLDINKTTKTVNGIDVSTLKEIDGTEFTLKFYKGYSELSQITGKTPDKTLVYKVINGKIKFDNPMYVVSGEPYELLNGNIQFPIGIAIITESKATSGYSTNDASWTDSNDNNLYVKDVGLVSRIIQDEEFGLTQIWNGSEWVDSDSATASFIFSVPNTPDSGNFQLDKTLIAEDGTTETKLKDVSFTLYYFDTTSSDPNEQTYLENEWNALVESINSMRKDTNGKYEYESYLSKAAWYDDTIKTDANGQYTSPDLPTGNYVLVENKCDANKGYTFSLPQVITIAKNTTEQVEVKNYTPSISTTEWDGTLSSSDYKTHMTNPGKNAKIVDEVYYSNLEGNSTYTIKGILMDITNGTPTVFKDANGNLVQSRVKVNTSDEQFLDSDTVLMEFPMFDATGKDGHTFVVFEFLFNGDDTTVLTEDMINILTGKTSGTVANAFMKKDNTVVGHYDATDANQIGFFPEIHTHEFDSSTLMKVSPIWNDPEVYSAGNWVNVSDTLKYTNIDENLYYTCIIYVKNLDNDNVLSSQPEIIYPSTRNGDITFDNIWFIADNVSKFYICEDLYLGRVSESDIESGNATLVATHHAKIEDQTGMIGRIGTTASASSATGKQENGINLAYISSNVTLTDTIKCENLNNELYDITCEYRYVGGAHDGELVKDATGRELKTTLTNKKLADGTIDVAIENLNLTNLKDETIVAYETIIYHQNDVDIVVAKEHQSTNKAQSVKFIGIPVKFNKINTDGTSLAGCKLEIRAGSKNGTLVDSWTTDGSTMHTIYMETGVYYLVETDAPDGYALADPVKFEIKGDGFVYVDDKKLEDGIVTIADAQLTNLPTAGGIGTTWFSLVGIMALLGSAYFVKKKQTD